MQNRFQTPAIWRAQHPESAGTAHVGDVGSPIVLNVGLTGDAVGGDVRSGDARCRARCEREVHTAYFVAESDSNRTRFAWNGRSRKVGCGISRHVIGANLTDFG